MAPPLPLVHRRTLLGALLAVLPKAAADAQKPPGSYCYVFSRSLNDADAGASDMPLRDGLRRASGTR